MMLNKPRHHSLAGNTFSRAHVKYSDQDSEFWRITVDDMALSDLPASVQYIQQVTGYEKVDCAKLAPTSAAP